MLLLLFAIFGTISAIIMLIIGSISGTIFHPLNTIGDIAELPLSTFDVNKVIADDVILFPCGVFNCDKHLFFSSGNAFNSGVSEKGDISIQGVAVDHVIPGFRPTFICMDVEGVEPEALRGAENILRQSKPDLAICVYHSPNHIWDIPLFIDSLDLGYKFYLRNYTSFLSETVLYGTVE